ncbi:MAG: NAD(P)H-dependent oxidoreductase [Succinivibrio sp.]|nr:NAD(P)H-dependent oxidoreductase [Succinivibrio sp.]
MNKNKTLIIVDHPAYDRSVVNRRWLEELGKYPDEFVVHKLQSAYPRGQIDVAKEHSLIENHGNLVFEFPVYWYNCPPMFKHWMDSVLTSDWAFGKGDKLKGVKVALAVTCGSEEEAYTAQGRHHRSIGDYMLPIIHAMERCEADFKGIYAYFGAANPEIATVEHIAQSAHGYVEFLRGLNA